ncbi:alpha/beta fold hydrolase [Pectobacterium brasiliense]|uniref:alpha/beta hydrolase n=1 Tax=Pectobacterium brasiliense TaxID=180957 RepID=UPI0032ED980E
MKRKSIYINDIPAILWGDVSDKVYLYIHGQGGNKEEVSNFSDVICRNGWQILSIDLPEHGERMNENKYFVPWDILPELTSIMEYSESNWREISLFANSIGAWFSMLGFNNMQLKHCFFLSPVTDMEYLISKMMSLENVTEQRLKEELIIPTSHGQTLSWKYWEYVLSHPITKWNVPTKILYGEQDHLIERKVVDKFSHEFSCELTIFEKGEHWFHTEQQLDFVSEWIEKRVVTQN